MKRGCARLLSGAGVAEVVVCWPSIVDFLAGLIGNPAARPEGLATTARMRETTGKAG
jgi:hypothetical protein